MVYPNTDQEIFDYCLAHLWKQNKQSIGITPGSACMYRNFYGHRCAIGCFIPDKDYKPEMEFHGLKTLPKLKSCPYKMQIWIHKHYNLLHDLQNMHDSYNYKLDRDFQSYILEASDTIANDHRLYHFVPEKITIENSHCLKRLQPS